MTLKLAPYHPNAWLHVQQVWRRAGDPPPSGICAVEDDELVAVLGYELTSGAHLLVTSVHVSPALDAELAAEASDYVCRACKHLATMLGRFPVKLGGAFVVKKSPQQLSGAAEGSRTTGTTGDEDNVTRTSKTVKHEELDW